jgi:TonB family protein
MGSLLLVAAIIFGIQRFGNLQDVEASASQLLTEIQNRAVVWQSAISQHLTFAGKPESDGATSNLSRLGSSKASAVRSKSAPAATGEEVVAVNETAAIDAAPAATPPGSDQIESQAVGRMTRPIATPGNNPSVKHDTVSFAGTSAKHHFAKVSFASATLHKAEVAPASAVLNQPAKPPSPETKLTAELIKQVDPIYPEQARIADITGRVELDAHIDESGKVREVHAISGNPALVEAAVDAVRQWEYKPSLVNGQPQGSDAHIVIAFSLR